ncbi:MAG TPA: hypothetical protein VNI54_07330 [Thermoanaerobaculia bacterium]|nr:hypothetical protein [Thermoanaerobaculia bacterium]
MSTAPRKHPQLSPAAARCRKKFLRFFPDGFRDETYLDWERGYKQAAHEQWEEQLGQFTFRALLKKGEFTEIAQRAARIEGKTNLLFSFEKMALRDAVKSPEGAEAFARGLYEFLYGKQSLEKWIEVVANLPRRQTRVLTWPLLTVFPFIAKPEEHIFLKPNVTRAAAGEYGFDFDYRSKPNPDTYASLRELAETIRRDQADLRPKDMIDLQSFIWVMGSDEYD